MNHEETRKSTLPLACLKGIEVRPIKREERSGWDSLVRQHHYLGREHSRFFVKQHLLCFKITLTGLTLLPKICQSCKKSGMFPLGPGTALPHRGKLRYIAVHQEQWLALIGCSAAAFKCRVRDQWIGWPCFLQYQRLSFIANSRCQMPSHW